MSTCPQCGQPTSLEDLLDFGVCLRCDHILYNAKETESDEEE